MKKVKVTRRPGASFVLRPSRVRMFLVYIVILALAIGVGLAIQFLFRRNSLSPNWFMTDGPTYLAIILGGAIIISLMEYSRWIIHVENGDTVEGPSGAFGERLSIQLKEIDWQRTRRSLNSWLKFGNAIYSGPRRRILISPWFFSPARFREFLSAIGYDKAGG
jgi:hypothetical protein